MRSKLSPLAVNAVRTSLPPARDCAVHGVVVHTTGSGVVEQALLKKRTALDIAIAVYHREPFFPHYLIGEQGQTVQICPDDLLASHAGIAASERALYRSGKWKGRISPEALALWQARWPSKESPLDLLPEGAKGVNSVFLGIELIPQLRPRPDGSLFTPEQYAAVAALVRDLRERHGIQPGAGRLIGHEDINPLTRTNTSGGWDPGALRAKPVFLWWRVTQLLELSGPPLVA